VILLCAALLWSQPPPAATADLSKEFDSTPGRSERAKDQSTPAREKASAPVDELEERARTAAARSLAWLAKEQDPDGSFSSTGVAGGASRAEAAGHAPVATTALCALAWMAGGATPGRGEHGAELRRSIEWLVACSDRTTESPRRGWISRPGDLVSRMHGHCYATLALAQAWSMSRKDDLGARVEGALREAIDLLLRAQGVEGGWWYEPERGGGHESSLTVCAVQALRGARDVGVGVDAVVVERALAYLRRTRREDGAFAYAIGDKQVSVALTAAGIGVLQNAGSYSGIQLRQGHDWIARALALRKLPDAPEAARLVVCPRYESLYLAQALWQLEDQSPWLEWRRAAVQAALQRQAEDGRFRDERFGDAYATSMESLVLLLPSGLLPAFQR
jgi:hypothetical protein